MARGNIGSFNGTVTANANMIDVFKTNEQGKIIHWPTSAGFVIRKIAVSATPGTVFTFNGAEIVLPSTGIFETDEDQVEVKSLVFSEACQACIVYLY
ncbi:MAG: hypothetical protein IKO94_07090 [Selenomonadaceae bacterium]|nr:hypothetical protein [Clostridia bacterium]MBR4695827.1 hypothetical protein [Selenomonadaceae bacterium]